MLFRSVSQSCLVVSGLCAVFNTVPTYRLWGIYLGTSVQCRSLSVGVYLRWLVLNTNSSLVVLGGYLYAVVVGLNDSDNGIRVYRSADGASWSNMGYDATPKGRVGYACVAFGSQIFVTGGYDSIFPSYKHADLWATSDFATWTEQNTSFLWGPTDTTYAAVSFSSYLWILGGYIPYQTAYINRSSDGQAVS